MPTIQSLSPVILQGRPVDDDSFNSTGNHVQRNNATNASLVAKERFFSSSFQPSLDFYVYFQPTPYYARKTTESDKIREEEASKCMAASPTPREVLLYVNVFSG